MKGRGGDLVAIADSWGGGQGRRGSCRSRGALSLWFDNVSSSEAAGVGEKGGLGGEGCRGSDSHGVEEGKGRPISVGGLFEA